MSKRKKTVLMKESQLQSVIKELHDFVDETDLTIMTNKKNFMLKELDSILNPEVGYRIEEELILGLKESIERVDSSENNGFQDALNYIDIIKNEISKKQLKKVIYEKMTEAEDSETKAKFKEIYEELK